MKMKKMIVKTAIPAVCIIAAALLVMVFAGCSKSDETASGGPAAPAVSIFAVNTTTAVQGQIRDYLALSGDIVAGSTVDTYSDAAGKVTRLYVSVGDRVSKGDAVAAVDPSRPGMTFKEGIARAPISGVVTALPAQVGMTISQAVPLARISGIGSAGGDALEIKLYVAERFISKMALHLPCQITLDAWPGETFRGSITEVAPTVDPVSRTMEVKVNVENPGSKLKAGMFAKVRIITEQKQNIVKIPSSALIQRFGETYVFVAESAPATAGNESGFVARRRIVTPGILIDNVLEIQDGLKPDEEVIIRGQTLLDDGARINIIDRVTPLSAN
ncbi:MAG: efflux RND transporter periplasmic adaptor subunit [Treponema sp.]|jgi:multidrug efflux pump subunit AcrA (membrane-fusion protein)|nr:efflux RND transporter periplasmic adaptor subunit [Treponema sp.]